MAEPDLGDQLLEPEPPVARRARAAECPRRRPRPTPPASRARPRARAAHTGAPRDSVLRSTCPSVDWRTYTTARRRRCASVIFARSLIALGLHQPRQQPRQPHRHLALALRRQRLPHRRRHHRLLARSPAPAAPTSIDLRFHRRLRRRRGRRARSPLSALQRTAATPPATRSRPTTRCRLTAPRQIRPARRDRPRRCRPPAGRRSAISPSSVRHPSTSSSTPRSSPGAATSRTRSGNGSTT